MVVEFSKYTNIPTLSFPVSFGLRENNSFSYPNFEKSLFSAEYDLWELILLPKK